MKKTKKNPYEHGKLAAALLDIERVPQLPDAVELSESDNRIRAQFLSTVNNMAYQLLIAHECGFDNIGITRAKREMMKDFDNVELWDRFTFCLRDLVNEMLIRGKVRPMWERSEYIND